jgi:hypothetical protein
MTVRDGLGCHRRDYHQRLCGERRTFAPLGYARSLDFVDAGGAGRAEQHQPQRDKPEAELRRLSHRRVRGLKLRVRNRRHRLSDRFMCVKPLANQIERFTFILCLSL